MAGLGSAFQVALTLKAYDEASAPLRQVQEAVRRTTEKIGTLRHAAEQLSAVGSRLRALGTGAMLAGGGGAALFGLHDVPAQAMQAEHRLRALGNVGGLTTRQLGAIRDQLRTLAPATNQWQGELIAGLETLVASGMDVQRAMAFLPAIGKGATAIQSAVADLAKTLFAVSDNLKVLPDEGERALNILAAAGKAGAFELKDMARYFPTLTAGAQRLGLQGVQGVAAISAALQVARKGAGDAGEAANNLRNFLQKVTAPETVRNFKAMGVSLEQELAQATAKGADPILHLVQLTARLTEGNPFKLGKLFGDMQVLSFLQPMIANLKEYQTIKDNALSAGTVIDTDFANMMTTTIEQWKRLKIAMAALAEPMLARPLRVITTLVQAAASNSTVLRAILGGIGTALVGGATLWGLGALIAGAGKAVATVATLRQGLLWTRVRLVDLSTVAAADRLRYLGIVPQATTVWGGLGQQIGVTWGQLQRVAAAQWGYATAQYASARATWLNLAGLKAQAITMGTTVRRSTVAASAATWGFVAAQWASLTAGLAAAGGIRALTLAMLSNPVTAWLVGLAAAAALVYKFWAPLSGFFKGLFKGIGEGWADMAQQSLVLRIIGTTVWAILTPLRWLYNLITWIIQPVEDVGQAWESTGARIGHTIGKIIATIADLPAVLLDLVRSTAWFQAGAKIMEQLWAGMTAWAHKPVQAMRDVATSIRNLLPFSPAKEGPLQTLHRIRLVETIAESVRPAPLVSKMRQTAAAVALAVPLTVTPAIAALSQSPAPLVQPHAAPRLAGVGAPAFAGVGPFSLTIHITINGAEVGGNPQALAQRVAQETSLQVEKLMRRKYSI